MRDTITTKTIADVIETIGNPLEPARSLASMGALERWLVDPLLILEPEQRTMIEDALREHGRL